MRVAFRRCGRVGPNRGKPVEDFGVSVGTIYTTNLVDDVLAGIASVIKSLLDCHRQLTAWAYYVRMRWLAVLLLTSVTLFGQSTIFVVRHADRYGTEPDPDITPEGQRQADSLGKLLKDSHITRIFTSEALRTRQTAEPTAQFFHVKPVIIDSKDLEQLVERVRAGLNPGEGTLVVGHRVTVPSIVKELTGKDVTPLEVGEYDRLEVVTMFPDGHSSAVTLRFGH